jgi:hypothetical protein
VVVLMMMMIMIMMMMVIHHIYIYILKVHRHGISRICNPSAILAAGATSGLHRTCLNHQIWWLTHIKSPFSLHSPSFLIKLPSPWISPPSSWSTHRIGRCNARSASYRSSRSSPLRRGWESESRVRCVFDVGENPKFQQTIPQVISILMPWSSTFIPKWLPCL